MLMLGPKYAMMDETDSGIGHRRHKNGCRWHRKIRRESDASIIVITHYNRFLRHLKPDAVSVLHDGKIVKTGGYEVAQQIEKQGFDEIIKTEITENGTD